MLSSNELTDVTDFKHDKGRRPVGKRRLVPVASHSDGKCKIGAADRIDFDAGARMLNIDEALHQFSAEPLAGETLNMQYGCAEMRTLDDEAAAPIEGVRRPDRPVQGRSGDQTRMGRPDKRAEGVKEALAKGETVPGWRREVVSYHGLPHCRRLARPRCRRCAGSAQAGRAAR
jgi:hypothetical protein